MTITSQDHQRTRRGLGLRIAGLLLLTILFSCCGDHPPKPEPVEYVLYYGNSANGDLYVFETDSFTIIDSIPNVGYAFSIVASPKGDWLYAQVGDRPFTPYLKKIDLLTGTVVDSLADDIFGQLTILDCGRLLLRGLFICRSNVIDPNILEITGAVADSICPVQAIASGTVVAAIIGGNASRIGAFDVGSGIVSGEYFAHLPSGEMLEVVDAIVSPDLEQVLVLAASSIARTWLLVGNLVTGETLLAYQLVYAEGQLAVNEDWSLAAVTDPSRSGIWNSAPTLDIFDLTSLQHLKRFVGGEPGGLEGSIRDIRFLPDTDLLIGTPSRGRPSDQIHAIDTRTLSVDRVFEPPIASPSPTAMAIGVRR